MVTLKEHVYAGRRLKPGREFEARGQSDARLLIALGRADFAPALPADEPAPQPAVIRKPEPQAMPVNVDVPDDAPVDDVDISPRTGKPRRQYKRRDLTAESGDD